MDDERKREEDEGNGSIGVDDKAEVIHSSAPYVGLLNSFTKALFSLLMNR